MADMEANALDAADVAEVVGGVAAAEGAAVVEGVPSVEGASSLAGVVAEEASFSLFFESVSLFFESNLILSRSNTFRERGGKVEVAIRYTKWPTGAKFKKGRNITQEHEDLRDGRLPCGRRSGVLST